MEQGQQGPRSKRALPRPANTLSTKPQVLELSGSYVSGVPEKLTRQNPGQEKSLPATYGGAQNRSGYLRNQRDLQNGFPRLPDRTPVRPAAPLLYVLSKPQD